MSSNLGAKRKLSEEEEDELGYKFRRIGFDMESSNCQRSKQGGKTEEETFIAHPSLTITTLKNSIQQSGSKRGSYPPKSPKSSTARKSINSISTVLESIPEAENEPTDEQISLFSSKRLSNSAMLETSHSSKPTKLRLYLTTSEFTFRSPLHSPSEDVSTWTTPISHFKLNPEHSQLVLYSPTNISNDSDSTSNSTPAIFRYSQARSPIESSVILDTLPNETPSEDVVMME